MSDPAEKDWCSNCGLCCMHMRTPPFCGPDDPRYQALPRELKTQLLRWIGNGLLKPSPRWQWLQNHFGEDAPCIWLDMATGRCRHYELRPDVCREYEVGNASCRSERKSVGLTVKGMPVAREE